MTYTKIKFSLLLCIIEFNKKNPYSSLSQGFFKRGALNYRVGEGTL